MDDLDALDEIDVDAMTPGDAAAPMDDLDALDEIDVDAMTPKDDLDALDDLDVDAISSQPAAEPAAEPVAEPAAEPAAPAEPEAPSEGQLSFAELRRRAEAEEEEEEEEAEAEAKPTEPTEAEEEAQPMEVETAAPEEAEGGGLSFAELRRRAEAEEEEAEEKEQPGAVAGGAADEEVSSAAADATQAEDEAPEQTSHPLAEEEAAGADGGGAAEAEAAPDSAMEVEKEEATEAGAEGDTAADAAAAVVAGAIAAAARSAAAEAPVCAPDPAAPPLGRCWQEAVRAAAEHILSRVDEAGTRLENINSSRLQLKLGRTLDAFPPPLRRVVEVLERRVAAACGLRRAELRVQDCYALLTPESEVEPEARAPQRWHLDAVRRFPVAALLLRGGRWTEFAAGPYSDFSAGVPEDTLERWCAPWKDINAPTWESGSAEEWEHWTHHLHKARLVTSEAPPECDWETLPLAPTPRRSHVGDASLFWSNKVHRGPGTDPGELRLVLFCSWMPASGRAAAGEKGGERGGGAEAAARGRRGKRESETDYNYFDTHLESKLVLSKRALRSIKRQLAP